MRRAFLLGLICAPALGRAQLILDLAQPQDARRAGADSALRRTVTLVVGGKLPGDIPALALPDRINRRLPHKRNATLWAAVGDALAEIDPVRLTLHSLVPGVLPPVLEDAR